MPSSLYYFSSVGLNPVSLLTDVPGPAAAPRKRGRPRGSKNKPKTLLSTPRAQRVTEGGEEGEGEGVVKEESAKQLRGQMTETCFVMKMWDDYRMEDRES